MSTIENYLTTQEVAVELGVTDARVRQMFAEGVLKGTRVGLRSLLFSVRDVAKLKKNRQSDQ